MFRDQSQEIMAKVSVEDRRIEPRARRKQARCSTPNETYEFKIIELVLGLPMMRKSPKLDKECGLTDFFTNNFTCCDDTWLKTSAIWIPQNFPDLLQIDCVKFGAQSCAAMSLARLHRDPEYALKARKKYGKALLGLADLSRQKATLNMDAFCLAAVFLSFFEVLSAHDKESRRSWMTHLEAIGRVYDTCDEWALRTSFSIQMFMFARNNVITHALQARTPVPEAFARSVSGDEVNIPPDFLPFDKADMLIARLANLQAQHQSRGSSSSLVSELVALCAACQRWMADLPPSWCFIRQANKHQWRSDWWWDARDDVYSARIIGNTWSKIRAAIIVAYDLIQDCLQHQLSSLAKEADPAVHESICGLSRDLVQELATDTCATIPLCYRPSRGALQYGARCDPPPLGTIFWFLRILEVVGSMNKATPELTDWIAQCFENIHDATGIVRAQSVAERLRSGHQGPILP